MADLLNSHGTNDCRQLRRSALQKGATGNEVVCVACYAGTRKRFEEFQYGY